MALPAVGNEFYPTPDEILAQLLADVRYSYAKAGLVVNVARGSELYLRYQSIANRLSIPIANNQIAQAGSNPLTATGDELEELASLRGITRRPANPASGDIVVGVTSGSVTIPSGYKCTSGAGIQYATTGSFTVSDGGAVTVEAVTAGDDSNLTAASVLTWDSAAIGALEQVATVGTAGLSDGADEDDDEALRRRLLRRLQYAASGGNPAQTNDWAEEASAAVEVAFTYPAARGPGSYDVAIVSTDADRVASATTVARVESAVQSEMPGHSDIVVTTVALEEVDLIIDVDLPLPVNAGGAGGGWRDATPWPSDADTTNVYAEITAIDIANRQITVNSTSADAPAAGKRFGIWDPDGGTDSRGLMHEYTIQSVGGGTGAYVLTIDASSSSLAHVVVGMFCSAGASNLLAYAAAVKAALRALGPGEKTTNVDILPRGQRTPGPDLAYPSELTSLRLAEVSGAYSEILDITFAATLATGTGASGTALFTTLDAPSVPSTTADPPKLLALKHLALRRKV